MSDEAVRPLTGGELLVSGTAVLWFATLAERAVHAQRSNGVRNPIAESWLGATIEASRRLRTADASRSAVPMVVGLAVSGPVDPITASEAAVLMNRTVRNVTDLCARGSFDTAQRVQGRWRLERAEVLARAERMAS